MSNTNALVLEENETETIYAYVDYVGTWAFPRRSYVTGQLIWRDVYELRLYHTPVASSMFRLSTAGKVTHVTGPELTMMRLSCKTLGDLPFLVPPPARILRH